MDPTRGTQKGRGEGSVVEGSLTQSFWIQTMAGMSSQSSFPPLRTLLIGLIRRRYIVVSRR